VALVVMGLLWMKLSRSYREQEADKEESR